MAESNLVKIHNNPVVLMSAILMGHGCELDHDSFMRAAAFIESQEVPFVEATEGTWEQLSALEKIAALEALCCADLLCTGGVYSVEIDQEQFIEFQKRGAIIRMGRFEYGLFD